jgi:hypothetical protein
MPQYTRTDLLPWILGGLLLAAAIPAVIAVTGSPNEIVRPVAAAVAAAPTPSAADIPAPAAAPPPLTAQPARPGLPPGQVWQCIVNGQKTFSDSPCGEGASIRQLNEVNRMDVTPVAPVARYPVYPASAPYYPPPAEQDPPQSDNGYISGQTVIINERARREHNARLHGHERRFVRPHY